MELDTTRSDRSPSSFQAQGSRLDEKTNLINCILELENKLVNKSKRDFQDAYQPDTRKLDVM